MKPILEVTGLRVERGRTTILDDVAWSVHRGEHWVILGANGSGKTSLLKTLTGFLTPTAGEIAVLGQNYGDSDWRALQLHIGVVTSMFAAAIPLAETALDTVMSGKFAQLDLWKNNYEIDVYRLSKKLDEEVARLHLEQLGVKLTKLTKEQSDYISVPVEGPYKPEHYRY